MSDSQASAPSRAMVALFMQDALDRVLHNPGASYCWLNLASMTRAWQNGGFDQGQLAQWQAQLHAGLAEIGAGQDAADGMGANSVIAFHWALYQDFVNPHASHLASATGALLGSKPADLDRMTAFFNFAWQATLARSRERQDFVADLQAAALPALAQRMGQMVAQAQPAHSPSHLPVARPITAIRKVAIVAPYLLSPRSTPSIMALEQAQLACQNGWETGLFSCQESLVPDFEKLLANGMAMTQDSYQLQGAIEERGLNLTVAVSDPRFSLMRRAQEMLAQISAFDPDLILVVGFHSCLAQALYGRRPVLALGVNSIAPLLPCDAWLAARPDLQSHPWGHCMPPSLAWHHPWRLQRKPVLAPLSREALGLPEQALVLVSSAWSSPIKIAPAWLAAMAAFLQRHPQVQWLLPGSDASLEAALQCMDAAVASQIRLLPGTENVMGVLACCDIYVNPPRMGGGFAVADAMAAGLPVLCFADSDGGDKLGKAGPVAQDVDGYFALLQQWVADPALRRELGARMRQQFDQQLDLAQAAPGLLAAGQAALAQFQARTGTAAGA